MLGAELAPFLVVGKKKPSTGRASKPRDTGDSTDPAFGGTSAAEPDSKIGSSLAGLGAPGAARS